MLQDFLTFINQNGLFQPTDRLLLAVSGGLDSTVLTHLCARARLTFGVAHCNFQLRGRESAAEEAFVRDLAVAQGADFFVERFDTLAFAAQNGLSTQMAARELRYARFEKIRQEHHYDWILTAHHQNDLLETVLLNLTRGVGWRGLQGILPKNGCVVRPLLFATQAAIEAFAQENNLQWREDSSNQTDDYQRNLLRHQVVPILQQLNPQVVGAVAQTAARVAALTRTWDENLRECANQVLVYQEDRTLILYPKLEAFSEPIERLAGLLRPFGFGFGQARLIWAARTVQAGTTFLSVSHCLTKDRDAFVLTQLEPTAKAKGDEAMLLHETERAWRLPHFGLERIDVEPTDGLVFDKNPDCLYLAAERVQFPLLARPWRAGDWFCPLGMGGKRKKVSDFLIDQKVPRDLKNKVWVLESAGEIAWVVGFRADERFKVKGDAEKIIKFLKIN